MTMSLKPSGGGPACKRQGCGKPGFKDSAGKMQHERRNDPAVYGGRRSDPEAKQKSGAGADKEPDREHFLNRHLPRLNSCV